MRSVKSAGIAAGMLLFVACLGEPVPDGRILVLNDSQDSSYNRLRVRAQGRSYLLDPGERVLLPKHSSYIEFSRRYPDHTKSYGVSCPHDLKKGIRIKLIDVHVNRIAGGCETVSASHK